MVEEERFRGGTSNFESCPINPTPIISWGSLGGLCNSRGGIFDSPPSDSLKMTLHFLLPFFVTGDS